MENTNNQSRNNANINSTNTQVSNIEKQNTQTSNSEAFSHSDIVDDNVSHHSKKSKLSELSVQSDTVSINSHAHSVHSHITNNTIDTNNNNVSNYTANTNTETKNSTSFNNLSHYATHYIPEVNILLEELSNIKNKVNDFLSKEELETDINRLQYLIDQLLKYTSEDPQIVIYINDAENEKDNKKYIQAQDQKHFATYNKYVDKEPEVDAYGNFIMSRVFLNKMICEKPNLYYRTHELNDILYLHFNGFKKIDNLESFINLKVLYLESNCIKKIEGLSGLKSLTCLYLQENCIEKIEGLEELKNLNTLNLSDNSIKKIENLESNTKLNSLLLKRNKIGFEEGDFDGLLTLSPTVAVIDISDNKISSERIVDDYLTKIPGLRVLYLFGNECTRKISSYRKTLTYKIKNLRYIDDKPIFEDERRFAEAFGRGGLDEERKERELYKQEKKDEQIKRVRDFQDMVYGWQKKNEAKNNEKENVLNDDDREKKIDSKMELLLKMNNKMKEDRMKKTEISNNNIDRNTENKGISNETEIDKIDKGVMLNIEEENINEIIVKENSNISAINNNIKEFNNKENENEEEVCTKKLKNNINFDDIDEEEDCSGKVKNLKYNKDEEDEVPSLENVKNKIESGWLQQEWENTKEELSKQNTDSKNVIDMRENNPIVKNTHVSNSIFDI